MGAAFVGFIHFYEYMKADHGVLARDLDQEARESRGDHAVNLALEMQRAMLALIGTHRRRTYAHDLVYGTFQLYKLFGKPWNAATEGNEHAHQDMKKYFHHMACHNPKNKHGDCYHVLRMTVIAKQLFQTKAHLLPHSGYAAMRANRIVAPSASPRRGAGP